MAATAPFAWYGGKATLAKWIISHFPEHRVYVEPYGGAASVLVAKPPSPIEIYNDVDGRLVNFFRVISHPTSLEKLQRELELTLYSRETYNLSRNSTATGVQGAADFFTSCRMTWGGLGGTANPFPVFSTSTRIRRGMPENVSKYLSAVDGLPGLAARFRSVIVEGLPTLKIIPRYDGSDTLFYLDPPYLPTTRAPGAREVYAHEMTYADHIDLLSQVRRCEAKFIISGYPSPYYDWRLEGWIRREKKTRTKINSKSSPRTEVLWMNFDPPASGDDSD